MAGGQGTERVNENRFLKKSLEQNVLEPWPSLGARGNLRLSLPSLRKHTFAPSFVLPSS